MWPGKYGSMWRCSYDCNFFRILLRVAEGLYLLFHDAVWLIRVVIVKLEQNAGV
jgi:hypothetical protein